MTAPTPTPPCRVMGVVNVTPDSFVGEVRTPGRDEAVARCHALIEEGANILDVGGESTRPGATPIPIDEELRRVLPVIEAVMAELPAHVQMSIDTRHEAVARAAVGAGATIINDMSASLGLVAGELGVGFVAAHMQGTPDSMQDDPTYASVVDDVLSEMVRSAEAARQAGAHPVWIDPGIGFGKTHAHNLEILANIDRFAATDFPVLIGVSRKGMIGHLHAASDAGVALGDVPPTPTDDRLEASIALAVWCALSGVEIVRVHDVAETVQAMQVAAARLDPGKM
ncbi:MAG: dihydropteroate synthase [Actinomycetota bacterium]